MQDITTKPAKVQDILVTLEAAVKALAALYDEDRQDVERERTLRAAELPTAAFKLTTVLGLGDALASFKQERQARLDAEEEVAWAQSNFEDRVFEEELAADRVARRLADAVDALVFDESILASL